MALHGAARRQVDAQPGRACQLFFFVFIVVEQQFLQLQLLQLIEFEQFEQLEQLQQFLQLQLEQFQQFLQLQLQFVRDSPLCAGRGPGHPLPHIF